MLVAVEQHLELDIGAQDDRPGRGSEVGRQRAREEKFAGTGKPPTATSTGAGGSMTPHPKAKSLRAPCSIAPFCRGCACSSRAAATFARIAAAWKGGRQCRDASRSSARLVSTG